MWRSSWLPVPATATFRPASPSRGSWSLTSAVRKRDLRIRQIYCELIFSTYELPWISGSNKGYSPCSWINNYLFPWEPMYRSVSVLFFLLVQFSSVQDGNDALGKANTRSTVSQKFPQRCLWKGSNVRLTDDGPLSSFQGRSSNASSFHTSLLHILSGCAHCFTLMQTQSGKKWEGRSRLHPFLWHKFRVSHRPGGNISSFKPLGYLPCDRSSGDSFAHACYRLHRR